MNQTRSINLLQNSIKKTIKIILDTLSINDVNLSILFCGKKFMQYLNNTYRGKNNPTDVLTFVYEENSSKEKNPISDEIPFGDIVICPVIAKKQCHLYNNDINTEIKRLLIHGLLHLFGYDHEKSKIAEKKMFDLQEMLLTKIKGIKVC